MARHREQRSISGVKARTQPSRLALNMITVSEPSAEVSQPVRTGRYTPARRRTSAARDDTPRYADARPIRVHTEERNRFKINNPSASGGPRSGMVPLLAVRVVAPEWRVHPVASAPKV